MQKLKNRNIESTLPKYKNIVEIVQNCSISSVKTVFFFKIHDIFQICDFRFFQVEAEELADYEEDDEQETKPTDTDAKKGTN